MVHFAVEVVQSAEKEAHFAVKVVHFAVGLSAKALPVMELGSLAAPDYPDYPDYPVGSRVVVMDRFRGDRSRRTRSEQRTPHRQTSSPQAREQRDGPIADLAVRMPH